MKRTVFAPLILLITALLALGFGLAPLWAYGQDQAADKQKKEKEQEKPVRITEEILVIGKAPREIPLATVTTIEVTTIDQMKPRDLSEAIKYAPGVFVTVGNKEEYTLKLRGIDSKRIALLVDGVPVVEPYYGSFDLKTVSAGGIESLQITKGPSSVLYGPNTLGGIVNVITRRPSPEPRVALNLAYGDRNTRTAGTDASFQWGRLGLVASALLQDSHGFEYRDPSGLELDRTNSDFRRANVTGKLVYNPTGRSEIMVDAGYYHSVYGMPPALYGPARYWRFPDWDRTSVNAGGYTALGDRSIVRFRGFYVNYTNVLDQFRDAAMTDRRFESTFDNSVYGFFGLGEFSLAGWNTLKVSLYDQADKARQQDDVGLPWLEFHQNTLSGAVEEHLALSERWTLIGGLSLDNLHKFEGPAATKANPLVGLKYSPSEALDIHVSYAGKSKFPSMRSLYSLSNGNPDLNSERGRSFELSAVYTKGIFLTASVFFTSLRDFIDTFTLPDGSRRFINIGKARINGAEFQVQKSLALGPAFLHSTVNYTFLDHSNEVDHRPLDALPKHNLNFDLTLEGPRALRFSLFGLWASKSWWWDTSTLTPSLLTIPAYISLDAVLSWGLRNCEPFIRMTNIFNHYFYTEPGFPWRGRYLEVGVKAGLF